MSTLAPEFPSVMTRMEVAKACRVCTRTVLRLERGGVLRAVRVGRSVRYYASEVAKLLAAKPANA
jgi:excisionase family DNA binding protein